MAKRVVDAEGYIREIFKVKNVEEVGFWAYWIKPMLSFLTMFKTGYIYRQIIFKDYGQRPTITRRYIYKEKIK